MFNIVVFLLLLLGVVGVFENSFMILFKIFFFGYLLVLVMLFSRGISFYVFVVISGLICIVVYVKFFEKVKVVKKVVYVR